MTKFEMKTMKDYHDAYLKRDVLLSAYLFEKFRNYSLKNYGLCPSWNRLKKLSLKLFQILTCIYPLRKVQEWNFLYF